ncbi:hypothetical protein ABZT04_13080 [Streptomyces sp. NPDC005492]|uniref:hypothetical protein n=1 Tax=Streptomyces sp. NPDC005492 TaxID=3156883 RepID=UPI0033BC4833
MPDPEHSEADVAVAFERVLDRALDSGQVRDAWDRSPATLDREELRGQVLQARTAISEAVAVEYRAHLEAGNGRDGGQNPASPAAAGTRGGRLLIALLVLVAVVAAVLLVAGFGLRGPGGRPYVGDGLLTAGLITGAVAVGATVGDFAWSLVGAADGASCAGGPEDAWVPEEWELALSEWGIVPFLLDRIEARCAAERDVRGGSPAPGRVSRGT